jgi:intracellular sulfur oxidation DsrE/DsrF family protein
MTAVLKSLRLVLAALFVAFAAPALAGDMVVYHIDNSDTQAMKGLRNIRNHLDVAPDTKITVVTHADGVDFLFDGAKDPKSGAEYGPLISGLKSSGVTFEVCQITMKRRNLSKDKFVLEAEYTPSGVVRLAQLQAREHYAYIKP